jgi:hypothetical protein
MLAWVAFFRIGYWFVLWFQVKGGLRRTARSSVRSAP